MNKDISIEDWFKQDETKVRGNYCSPPFDNIFIGSDPQDGMTKEVADSFDAILNVSCTPCSLFHPSRPDQRTYWVPVNEMGVWNYSAIVSACKILDFHHSKGHKIYIHCHAGAYRSPTMVMIWLHVTQKMDYKFGSQMLKTEMSLEEAYKISKNYSEEEYSKRFKDEKPYRLTYFKGNMPPAFNEFINRLRYNIDKNWCYLGSITKPNGSRISRDREIRANIQGFSLSNRLKRPFRVIKYKFNNLKEWFMLLVDGKRRIYLTKGTSTTIKCDGYLRTFIRKLRKINER